MRYVEYFALQCAADAAGDAAAGGAYWDAISRAAGPWARGASTKATPQPAIRLQSLTLSHVPAQLLASACSPLAQSGALEWRVYSGSSDGGADCSGGDGRCRDEIARLPVTARAGAGAGAAAVPAETPAIAGDFRVALYLRKRRLLDCSLHTAFLPLPRDALEAVGGSAGAATLGAIFTAPALESREALCAGERVRTPFGVGTVRAAPYDAGGFTFVSVQLPWAQAVLRAESVAVLRLPTSVQGTATFTKRELDVVVKDKRHVLWPHDFSLTISYTLGTPQ
jgi:hypothetical protein